MHDIMTPARPVEPAAALRRCGEWSDIPKGPHGPHGWHGRICPGLGPIEALTFSQLDAIAAALGMMPSDLLSRIIEHDGEAQR